MRVGFVGLGIMGKPMARNLIKAGHELVVYDVAPQPAAELAASGATARSVCPGRGGALGDHHHDAAGRPGSRGGGSGAIGGA